MPDELDLRTGAATDERLLQGAAEAYEADDPQGAGERFTAPAERDLIKASRLRGALHKTDAGQFSDPDRSGFWYAKYLLLMRRAAEGGDLDAMLSMGRHYQYGDLVSIDQAKAQSLISRA